MVMEATWPTPFISGQIQRGEIRSHFCMLMAILHSKTNFSVCGKDVMGLGVVL